MRIICLLFIIFIIFGTTKAQTDTIRTQQIDEVEVIASSKPSVTAASTPLQVMTSDDINRTGVQTVADAVRRFSGVVVKDFGGIGGLKTISIRGIGAEHTAVFYDGIAISNPQSGQIDISKYPLDNISMLSLAIGQPDNIFRSARAMASVGSLSLQTVTPHFTDKPYLAQVQLKAGSWGYFSPYVYYAHKLSRKISISVDGSWQRSDGKYSYDFNDDQQREKRKRQNSDVEMFRTEVNLFADFTETQQLKAKVYYFDSERGLPGYVKIGDPAFTASKQRLYDKDFFTQFDYTNRLSNKFDLQLKGKYSHLYTRFEDGKNTASNVKYNQDEVYFSGIGMYKLSDAFSLALAEDFSFNTARADYDIFPDPDRYTSLTSLSAKYENKYLTVIGNLLGTYIWEHTPQVKSPDNKSRFSPSVSLSYKPFAAYGFRVRAYYKDVYRPPTFNELYYKRWGNIHLKPEKSAQYNFGITWSGSFGSIVDYVRFTADGYYNNVKDKIIVYATTFDPVVRNMGKVEIKGIDLTIDSRFSLTDKLGLYLSGSYTYQQAIDKTKTDNNKHYKHQIPYTPEHSGAFSFSFENPWVNLSYSFVASGKMYGQPQNIKENEIDGYIDHTVSVNKSFRIKKVDCRLQGEIINLTGKNYYIVDHYPMPGRSFRLSMNINF